MIYDADGKLVKRTYDTVNKAFDNAAMKTYTVVNRKGFNLPTTGGFGTLLFSGIGVLLVLAGVSVLFSLKKRRTSVRKPHNPKTKSKIEGVIHRGRAGNGTSPWVVGHCRYPQGGEATKKRTGIFSAVPCGRRGRRPCG